VTSRRAGALAAGLLAAVVLTGCSGGENDRAPTSTTGRTAPSATPSYSVSGEAPTPGSPSPAPLPSGRSPDPGELTPETLSPSTGPGLPIPIPSPPAD